MQVSDGEFQEKSLSPCRWLELLQLFLLTLLLSNKQLDCNVLRGDTEHSENQLFKLLLSRRSLVWDILSSPVSCLPKCIYLDLDYICTEGFIMYANFVGPYFLLLYIPSLLHQYFETRINLFGAIGSTLHNKRVTSKYVAKTAPWSDMFCGTPCYINLHVHVDSIYIGVIECHKKIKAKHSAFIL